MGKDSEPTAYVFRCLPCEAYLAYRDETYERTAAAMEAKRTAIFEDWSLWPSAKWVPMAVTTMGMAWPLILFSAVET